jgi:hypothetical protein
MGRNVSGEDGWRREPDQASQRNCQNEPHLAPNCGHGDPSLTPEGGWNRVLRRDKVVIGNSDSRRFDVERGKQ